MNDQEMFNKITEMTKAMLDLSTNGDEEIFVMVLLRMLSQITYQKTESETKVYIANALSNAFDIVDGDTYKVPTYVSIVHDLSAVTEAAVVTGIADAKEGEFHCVSTLRENYNKSLAELAGYEYTDPDSEIDTSKVVKH